MEDRHEATGHLGGAVPQRDHPVLTGWAEDERPEDPTTWADTRVRRVVAARLERPETHGQLGAGEAPTCRDLAAELRDGVGWAPDNATRDAVDAALHARHARPGRYRGLRLRGRGGPRTARDAGART